MRSLENSNVSGCGVRRGVSSTSVCVLSAAVADGELRHKIGLERAQKGSLLIKRGLTLRSQENES